MGLLSIPMLKRAAFLLKNKGLKYVWNRYHIYLFYYTNNRLALKLVPWFVRYPPYFEIEVSTKCNLRCTICEHTYWKEPYRDMSFENFKKIIDQFPNLKWIGLVGIGEAFLNKDILRMIKYIKQKSKATYIEMYDTFYFIDEKVARVLIEDSLDRLIASIDGATKETYEKIRVGSNFERVVKNVRNFIRLKKEMNTHFPELWFHFIITKDNLHEMPKYVEFVHSICDGEAVQIQFTKLLHEFNEIKPVVTEVPTEIIQETEDKARKLGIGVVWNWNFSGKKPLIAHCTAWLMPLIFVTGHVVPCCQGCEANVREFQKEYSFGNAFEKSFKDLWHSDQYKKFRQLIREGKVPIQCRDCGIFEVGRELK